MQHIHNRQTSIDPDEIRQLQRTHGYIRPVLHDIIDILLRAHARLQADDGFVDIRHQDPVCQKPRGIRRLRGGFPHLGDERQGGVDGGLGSLEPADDLHAFLHGDGVHEMGAYDPGSGGQVGGVVGGLRGCGDLGDGYGGGVCGEDGVRGADGG